MHEMTVPEAEQFIASVPWRKVREVVYTDTPVAAAPDRHWYTVRDWVEVDPVKFDRFVALIRTHGYRGVYRAPYAPNRPLYNRYLALGEWCYWSMSGPGEATLVNRCRAEDAQHERLPEQLELGETS